MPVRDLLMSAGGASAPATYVEDVFSTYLYTSNNASITVNNGIDLASKGGMVWIKSRSNGTSNELFDTLRGVNSILLSNGTSAAFNYANEMGSFNSDGFTVPVNTVLGGTNFDTGRTYASWTFRKQPNFFDVVTYTGDGTGSHTIAHNLGSTPAMIIVKNTTTASFGDWNVWHKNLPAQSYSLYLNTTGAAFSSGLFISQNSTSFTVGYDRNNQSGVTYVAYLFASNAGGFGTAGTDNVITCGGYTGTGSSNISINLGYEPQYILIKNSSSSSSYWYVQDVMRGMSYTSSNILYPNRSDSESVAASSIFIPTATGFNTSSSAGFNTSGNNYIYMAIRRPMKVPTDATTVFSPNTATLTGSANTVTTNFPVDLAIPFYRQGFYANWFDRLRGDSQSNGVRLRSASSNAEVTTAAGLGFDNNNGYVDNYDWTYVSGTGNYVYWNFRRATGFFDVVCYTGTGSATTQAHNLGVVPELMIVKDRSSVNDWWVYHSAIGNTEYSVLNTTAIPVTSSTAWNNTTPTSSVFSIGTGAPVNTSGDTYVTYLFATCPGVSKVGSYTGNGTTQAIACGFTGGARFVMIKRTDSTSDWFVYDTARGMTTLVDPYLPMNGVTEVATLGSVTTTTGGFTVDASILAAINTSGASYIFLAIA